ncbi:MAG: STT3 domain-containing protein, partial [Methanobacterium sp.]|nr:STT3 domain-containing protein [Methanobacterium sp.]
MNAKELLYKYKSLIIIILLFLVVFTVRAEAANIGGVPDEAKSFYQDPSGIPYFSEMDSYYHLRLTSDLMDHGYLGDKFNGSQWDLHSSYPPGKSANYPPLIGYLAEIGYIITNLFVKVPLVAVCFWMGAFIASLAVIPAYFLVKKITNIYGGIVAGLLVGLAPAYVGHTHAGFFDTDMFGMIIPLFIVLFFVISLSADNFRKRAIYASLAAFAMLLFALAWQGWWYIY